MTDIHYAVEVHKRLVDRLREQFPDADEDTIADTAAGETTLDECIAHLLRAASRDEQCATAMAAIVRDNQQRKIRYTERCDKLRALALWALQEAGLKKIGGTLDIPDLIVSVITPKSGKVTITNEALIPDELCKIERTPRKGDIAARIAQGEEVPGATTGNPEAFLIVRWR